MEHLTNWKHSLEADIEHVQVLDYCEEISIIRENTCSSMVLILLTMFAHYHSLFSQINLNTCTCIICVNNTTGCLNLLTFKSRLDNYSTTVVSIR